MIMVMPTSRMIAVVAGNRQFMVSDCRAKVSAVTRYSRSPAWARVWKAIDSRCRWAYRSLRRSRTIRCPIRMVV